MSASAVREMTFFVAPLCGTSAAPATVANIPAQQSAELTMQTDSNSAVNLSHKLYVFRVFIVPQYPLSLRFRAYEENLLNCAARAFEAVQTVVHHNYIIGGH